MTDPAAPGGPGTLPLPNPRWEEFARLCARNILLRENRTLSQMYIEVYGGAPDRDVSSGATRLHARPQVQARIGHLVRDLRETYVQERIRFEELVERIRAGVDASDTAGEPNWSARRHFVELALKLIGKHPDAEVREETGRVVILLPDNGRVDG